MRESTHDAREVEVIMTGITKHWSNIFMIVGWKRIMNAFFYNSTKNMNIFIIVV